MNEVLLIDQNKLSCVELYELPNATIPFYVFYIIDTVEVHRAFATAEAREAFVKKYLLPQPYK
jgi:hypothetical protein